MVDTRYKANRDENTPLAISYELAIDTAPPTRPLNAEEIAILRAFFDLLAHWDESLSKSEPHLRD